MMERANASRLPPHSLSFCFWENIYLIQNHSQHVKTRTAPREHKPPSNKSFRYCTTLFLLMTCWGSRCASSLSCFNGGCWTWGTDARVYPAQVNHGPVARSLQGQPGTNTLSHLRSLTAYPLGLWEKAGDVNSTQECPLPQGGIGTRGICFNDSANHWTIEPYCSLYYIKKSALWTQHWVK